MIVGLYSFHGLDAEAIAKLTGGQLAAIKRQIGEEERW